LENLLEELTWQILLQSEIKKPAAAILEVQQQQQLFPSLLQPLRSNNAYLYDIVNHLDFSFPSNESIFTLKGVLGKQLKPFTRITKVVRIGMSMEDQGYDAAMELATSLELYFQSCFSSLS